MKRIIHNLSSMGELPYFLLRCGLILACSMVASALVILVFAGPMNLSTYPLYQCASQMQDGATAVLFVTVLGSAIVQDTIRK